MMDEYEQFDIGYDGDDEKEKVIYVKSVKFNRCINMFNYIFNLVYNALYNK
jgi:hypothetical protein